MKLKSTFLLFIFIFLLVSCSKIKTRIDVSYDPQTQKGNLLVDGKLPFKLSADSTSVSILIYPGNHKFKLNNGKEFTQNIPQEGGILNLNNDSFVTVIQSYGSKETDNPYGINVNEDLRVNQDFVIIDSMIYYYKKDSVQTVTDADLQSAINLDKKLGGASGIRYYEPKKFITKDWDYGLNEDFPESITEKTSSTSASYILNRTYKNKVMQSSLFKLYALMSPEYFEVRNIKDVMLNKLDKQEDNKKETKQMKFE